MGRGYEKKRPAFVGAAIYCWSTCRPTHKSGRGKCGGHCFNDFALRLKVRRKKNKLKEEIALKKWAILSHTKASGDFLFPASCAG